MTSATRRQGARPSRATQPQFARLDSKKVLAEARQATLDSLGQIADLRERRAAALAILDDAETALPDLRAKRDRLAASASIYDRVRGVNHAAGINRTRMVEIKREAIGGAHTPFVAGTQSIDHEALAELARANGLKHDPRAIKKLPDLGEKVLRLTGEAEAARRVRDEVTAALIASGEETKMDAAQVIGRTPAIITRLTANDD